MIKRIPHIADAVIIWRLVRNITGHAEVIDKACEIGLSSWTVISGVDTISLMISWTDHERDFGGHIG